MLLGSDTILRAIPGCGRTGFEEVDGHELCPTAAERRDLELLAKALVETCMRNSELENLHAGRFPSSERGDFSDVKVVTPYGEIPWPQLSRISDAEMKILMIDVVDRVFSRSSRPSPQSRIDLAR